MGTQNRSAVGTLVERSTRYLLLVHMPGSNRAGDLRDGLIRAMVPLPAAWRTSNAEFTAVTGVPVYLCDPQSRRT